MQLIVLKTQSVPTFHISHQDFMRRIAWKEMHVENHM